MLTLPGPGAPHCTGTALPPPLATGATPVIPRAHTVNNATTPAVGQWQGSWFYTVVPRVAKDGPPTPLYPSGTLRTRQKADAGTYFDCVLVCVWHPHTTACPDTLTTRAAVAMLATTTWRQEGGPRVPVLGFVIASSGRHGAPPLSALPLAASPSPLATRYACTECEWCSMRTSRESASPRLPFWSIRWRSRS